MYFILRWDHIPQCVCDEDGVPIKVEIQADATTYLDYPEKELGDDRDVEIIERT